MFGLAHDEIRVGMSMPIGTIVPENRQNSRPCVFTNNQLNEIYQLMVSCCGVMP
jgi:hypothetical protein